VEYKELADVARQLNMEVLFEIHAAHELKLLENIPFDLIGINNRNLSTLAIDIQTCHDIAPLIPADKILVCESGITSPNQVPAQARAVLIGTALVKDPNLLSDLTQTPR
jgi:indole-3-glycerol phosphate synthase